MPDQSSQSPLEQELIRGGQISIGFPWRLFLFALTIFVMVALLYAGLAFGYKPFLNSQIKDLNKEIENLNQSVSGDELKNFSNIYSQAINLKNLLDSHIMVSQVFSSIEKITHQKIYYSSFDLSVKDRKIGLNGNAPSFGVFASQIEIFRQTPEIEKVETSGAQAGNEGVAFKVDLILKDNFFK